MNDEAKQLIASGERSAQRLERFDPRISANFEICRCVGKLIAAWDRPEVVAAAVARHMRADDYVVGMEYKGRYRAYPIWITDNYHMINDELEGEPILFSTCERCQSGSAFIAKLDGKTARFSAQGMYNAALTMVNRRGRPDAESSLWLHYEGVGIDGPRLGHFLEQIPTFHMTWLEWKTAHPNSDVMLPPDDEHHRDARHGHGREEFFSRPGMDPPLAKTITGAFDHRYAENEMVLGLNIDAGLRAYPRVEVGRAGGVVNDMLGDLPVVILAGPGPDQCTMAAYLREASGQELTFEADAKGFTDQESGSRWTIEGLAVAGPRAGERLTPLRWQYVRWHAWVYPHPATELFIATDTLPLYPDLPATPQVEALQPLLQAISGLGHETRLSNVILSLMLPQEAGKGLCVRVGEDRLNLYRFHSALAAKDYVALQGAWYCWPFDVKLGRKRSRQAGRFVVESDPDQIYAEPSQTVRFPDNEVRWSELVLNDEIAAAWSRGLESEDTPGDGFVDLVSHLKGKRIDVVEVSYLPHSQLRVGVEAGVAATFEGDRFAVYRCGSERAASAVVTDVPAAFRIDRWVFRSIPVLMYQDPYYEMGQLPDDRIPWSDLVSDEKFHALLAAYLRPDGET